MKELSSPTTSDPASGASVLGILRSLLPNRRLLLSEALRIAELQAERLRRLRGYSDIPVSLNIIKTLPRLLIEQDDELPAKAASGVSYWDATRRSWIIGLNSTEPATRQRLSALHEYKHIVDHYHPGIVDHGRRPAGMEPAEYVADYFAGCVLVPKRLLKAAYYDGIQRVTDLAELFDVSRRAIEVRLTQVGLSDRADNDSPRYRLQRPAGGTEFVGATR